MQFEFNKGLKTISEDYDRKDLLISRLPSLPYKKFIKKIAHIVL